MWGFNRLFRGGGETPPEPDVVAEGDDDIVIAFILREDDYRAELILPGRPMSSDDIGRIGIVLRTIVTKPEVVSGLLKDAVEEAAAEDGRLSQLVPLLDSGPEPAVCPTDILG